MVSLPEEFVATWLPGYFWNIDEQKLYSIKIGGILRPLKLTLPNRWNNGFKGYLVSHNGSKKYMKLSSLQTIVPKDSVISVMR